jgi:sulfide:quinone oxidoreductase
MNQTARITVAGAGFAAITGVRELRKQLPDADITLVAPKPEFIYLPSLIWVPYGMRKGGDLCYKINVLLYKFNV